MQNYLALTSDFYTNLGCGQRYLPILTVSIILQLLNGVAKRFTAAFGQNSGIAHGFDGFFELPRFAFNEQYGSMDRLTLAIDGLPLKANQIVPADVVIDKNPPALGFTLVKEIADDGQLRCFNSTYGKLRVDRIGPRAEVRFPGALPTGRARVNCTMPGPDGRWRWFGKQFLVP